MIGDLAPFLQYGSLGLASILAILTYTLLKAESRQTEPRERMLKAIHRFFAATIILAAIAGTLAVVESLADGSADSADVERVAAERDRLREELAAERTKLASLKEAARVLTRVRVDLVERMPDDATKAALQTVLTEMRALVEQDE